MGKIQLNSTINYYNKQADSLSKRYESADISFLQRILLETFSKNSNLMEIGCGSGRDAAFMLKNGYHVLGIDASKNMIYEAKKLHPELKEILKVSIVPEDLDFKESYFDGIYSIATLMHLKESDIDKTLAKIYKFLKNKGRLLFSVSVNRSDLNQDHNDEKGRLFTILDQDKWIDICLSKGFKILKTEISNDGLKRDNIKWLTCIMEKHIGSDE